MTKITSLHDLLQQDVSRKEFLKYLGVGLLTLIGVTSIVNNLAALQPSNNSNQKSSQGYGTTPYGR